MSARLAAVEILSQSFGEDSKPFFVDAQLLRILAETLEELGDSRERADDVPPTPVAGGHR